MNYKETLDWLYVQLPVYQKQGKSAYKANLDNIEQLTSFLQHPEKKFKSIHVGGTNGKGSTSHLLASVFQEAGYKVGLYTSPHLKDFRERIRVDGNCVREEYVVDFVTTHKAYFESHQLSFFEMTVGMAFQYFADQKVDVAIIEVGLGGRLDATNVITPEISVITNIGIDHTQFLGNTITSIAREKAGIIKTGIPVVIGRKQEASSVVFEAVAKEKKAPLIFAETFEGEQCISSLKGGYQRENERTVLQVLAILRERGWELPTKCIKEGFSRIVENTGLLGRWQILNEAPKVICDTAHNEDGLREVMKQLVKESFRDLHIVVGVVDDKKLETILPLFPKKARYYFSSPDISRGLDAGLLKEEAAKFDLHGEKYDAVKEAYMSALQYARKEDVIYVGGSTFVVAEII